MALAGGRTPWRLRDPRPARRRRHGRGVQSHRHSVTTQRRSQDPSRYTRHESRSAAPLRAGSAGGRRAQSSEPARGIRHRNERALAPTWSRSSWKARRFASACTMVHCQSARRSITPSRSPMAWRRRTRRESFIGISSPRTSFSPGTGESRFSILAWQSCIAPLTRTSKRSARPSQGSPILEWCSAPLGTCRPNRCRRATWTRARTCFRSVRSCYEMLTGTRAFGGNSAVETMNAILKEDPPDPTVQRDTPPLLTRIVRRCLEKSPDQRFQSARDLAFALDSVSVAGLVHVVIAHWDGTATTTTRDRHRRARRARRPSRFGDSDWWQVDGRCRSVPCRRFIG